MRLDKFLAENFGVTRSQAGKLLRQKLVTVNGDVEKSGHYQVQESDQVCLDGEPVQSYTAGHYIMLNKPAGVECSHKEENYPSVLGFFDYPLAGKLHCAGRLDADTTGLVLLTDDGQWSHRITSPKHHCPKTYLVTLADPIEPDYEEKLAGGLMLRGEQTPTAPAIFKAISDYQGYLTLTEGRYHQVKRMFGALGNKVIDLHREQVGDLALGDSLAEGEWRELTDSEILALAKPSLKAI